MYIVNMKTLYINMKIARGIMMKNKFQTYQRFKVRGVFDIREAAEDKAKRLALKIQNMFVGQVGYWLPWDLNRTMQKMVTDNQLNEMMEKYQENNINRDIFYEEQKREKVKAAQEELRRSKEENKKIEEKEPSKEYPIDAEPVEEDETPSEFKKASEVSDDIKDSLESDDPWLQRKK